MTKTQTAEFQALRKSIIKAEVEHLNEKQQEAALTTEGPLLLLAGAGSGKTTVLISRIANLMLYGSGSDSEQMPEGVSEADLAFLRLYKENIENLALKAAGIEKARFLCQEAPVRPWEILAITFTNKAADELKHRLEKRLGEEARDIWAMTFHAACVRILRRFIDRLGYDTSFTIYDTADCQSLIKRILSDLSMDDKTYPPRKILSEISSAKDAQLDAKAFEKKAEEDGDHRRRKMAKAYKEYEKRLRAAGAVDFDDLLFLTVKLLQANEEVRRHYQRQFRYILIDEYQDTNNLQYLFASLLAEGHRNICVVGDDDQSIYKFRGATIQNILNFEHQYPGVRTIRLEQNYRSTAHILNAANAVITNNKGRKGKRLWTDLGDGEQLTHYQAQSQEDEADYVARCMVESFGTGGSWSDHAILYRMSAISNQLEFAMKKNGIPYKIVGGLRFFDRAEVKDILAYLAVIANPADDLRLLRIINVPPRGLGQTTIERLREFGITEGRPISETLMQAAEQPELARASGRLKLFDALMLDLREKLGVMRLDEFYEYMLEATGYLAMLREKPEENMARIEHIQELKSNIVSYLGQNEEGDLKGFLDEIALYTDLNAEENQEAVTLMTMHSAKGLEFDNVYLVGLEEGIFPGHRSIGEQEEMEEERRLCYVALTRAKRRLHVISAARRMLFGRTTANMPSRFLEEIPEIHIEKKGNARPTYRDADISFESEEQTGYRGARLSSKKVEPAGRAAPLRRTAPMGGGVAPGTYQKGDNVAHKAFGKGVIKGVTHMGGDALVEIEFETGTKRLMLKAASQHMEKV